MRKPAGHLAALATAVAMTGAVAALSPRAQAHDVPAAFTPLTAVARRILR